MDAGKRIKSIIGGSAGNLVEWYDWYAYAAFTLYFAPQFFPKNDDPTVALLSAAGVFAGGFLMRPLGAWLMASIRTATGARRGWRCRWR